VRPAGQTGRPIRLRSSPVPTIIPADPGSSDRVEDRLVTDVVIVGGGPSGAAAAITLARAGRDVVVIDKAVFPRDKCCGDGLTTGALRRLEGLGLDPAEVPSWHPVDKVVLRPPGGRGVTFPLPLGAGQYAAVARRAELDAALLDVARRAGATVHEGHAFTGVRVGADRIALDVDRLGWVVGRYAIGADGMWSPLRKALGAGSADYRGEWHAFRQYFGGVSARASRELWCSFEPDLLPGYLWSFPVGEGQANVGFGIRRGGTRRVQEMGAQWPDLLRRPHVRAFLGPDTEPLGPHRAWPIPARVGTMEPAHGRALFVGDAQAATDPLTGEGIGQALATGIWAAEALIAAGPYDDERARTHYRRQVREGLVADHWLAEKLSTVLAHPAGADGAIALAGLSDWTRRNFARWLFEDYPRAVVGTPRRWQRGLWNRPGAYRQTPSRRAADPPVGVDDPPAGAPRAGSPAGR
jgi:geranylgeranyl reductase family protein